MPRDEPKEMPHDRSLLASVVENADAVQVYVLDRDYVYASFNEAHARAMRSIHDAEIAIGAGILECMTREEDRLRAAADYARALEGERFSSIAEQREAEGSRWYESFLNPLRDERGLPEGVTVFVVDVTERERAEEALREREQRLSRIQNAMSDVVFYIAVEPDGDYRFVSVNRAFLAETGLREEQVCGKRVQEVIPEPAHELVLGNYAEAIHERKTVRWEEVSVYPAGKKRGEVAVTPLFDERDRCTHLVGTVRDVTEYRRLESRVQQAQKLESLGILAGGIAHDFNNLLACILGNADLAHDDLPSTSRVRPFVGEVIKASRQAAELTNQLLAYSGRGHFVVKEHDLNTVVTEMGSLLQTSVSKKVELTYSLADDLPPVMGDVSQLRQIVMNFVTNASAACRESGGRIEIKTGVIDCESSFLRQVRVDEKLPEGRYVSIQVIDNGSGMDEETSERIFDPFFTTEPEGRGLGLAAVLGIVRGHKGGISVESEPGVGTTFNVLLPALEHGTRSDDSPRASRDEWQGSGTVLVVDDVEMIRELASRFLERLGFAVITASDGAEAVELFRERHAEIVCVLLDLQMPQMGGDEAFEELRAIREEIPVVLSSGYSERESTKHFAGKGPAGFLHKPYDLTSLRRVLDDVLVRPAVDPARHPPPHEQDRSDR